MLKWWAANPNQSNNELVLGVVDALAALKPCWATPLIVPASRLEHGVDPLDELKRAEVEGDLPCLHEIFA